ncbi:hypothetical protein DPMN_179362 [Dreissena polymorpha]|uniref:Uncharacterized protein n=1 Tax=Dreissena polymorpha TaxID=45954 RepID=A0A9D4EEL7_DREPO|nr:hypothetical protein DPMN_179362 [Dreissena polymorpha]
MSQQTFKKYQSFSEISRHFCQMFTEVMTNISRILCQRRMQAPWRITFEQPNQWKMLLEIQDTTEDTYTFFIWIATESTDFIEKYLAGEAINVTQILNMEVRCTCIHNSM